MTWRKVFHILLPISQIAYLVCFLVYGYFCISLGDQLIGNILGTSIGGYVLAVCFLVNALHWAFFATTGNFTKLKNVIIGAIILFCVIVPFVLLLLITIYYYKMSDHIVKDGVHFVQVIYTATLNVVVIIVMFISWLLLSRRLKQFALLHTIRRLKRKLTLQMSLYITFFAIRAICLLVLSIRANLLHDNEGDYAGPEVNDDYVNQVLLFFSIVLGNAPLNFVMLHFLAHKARPRNAPLDGFDGDGSGKGRGRDRDRGGGVRGVGGVGERERERERDIENGGGIDRAGRLGPVNLQDSCQYFSSARPGENDSAEGFALLSTNTGTYSEIGGGETQPQPGFDPVSQYYYTQPMSHTNSYMSASMYYVPGNEYT